MVVAGLVKLLPYLVDIQLPFGFHWIPP